MRYEAVVFAATFPYVNGSIWRRYSLGVGGVHV
jgi:hypothetical protein